MSDVSIYDQIYQMVTFINAILSIIFTSIGLYLLITKRKSIQVFFKLLTNYALQTTISELHGKLDKLNEYSANDNDIKVKREIECILHDINGQIEGNKILKSNFANEQKKLHKYIENPDNLSEPLKRGLVSVLREKLKTLNLETYNDLARGEDE